MGIDESGSYTRIGVRMPSDEYDKLEELAKKKGVPLAAFCRWVLQNKIIMFLRGEPNRTAKKSKLLRYIRKPAKEVNTALETMEEAEMIVMFQGKEEGVKKQPLYIRCIMD